MRYFYSIPGETSWKIRNQKERSKRAIEVIPSKKKACTRQKECWRRATPRETAKTCREHTEIFSTKQALSRGIKQVEKALPVSPRKKTEVIRGLVKQYQIRVKLAETRGRKQMVLSEEEKEWLLTFFDRLDITYINPGRKDNGCIGKENGIRRYVQKRYLLWKLRDLLIINKRVGYRRHEGGWNLPRQLWLRTIIYIVIWLYQSTQAIRFQQR